MTTKNDTNQRPNILFFMVDQMHYPRFEQGGFDQQISDILGFKDIDHLDSNQFAKHYPGFMALRENAVVLKNHRIATAACVPSRTALFTGQYGTKTGSTQTDGLFKSGTSKRFPWLRPSAMPTIGSYMRLGGYSSHYFGKWHISGEGTTDLDDYGFSDWELSYPDPHGYLPNNLGYFRDYQFQDLACSFIRRQGLAAPYNAAHAKKNAHKHSADEPQNPPQPWFAVCSFANPHDIASYPGIPSNVCDQRVRGQQYTLAVPEQNSWSEVPEAGTMRIRLNASGLDQYIAENVPSWNEDLKTNNKPQCQLDYSYKMGLALAATPILQAVQDNAPSDASRDEIVEQAAEACLRADITGLPLIMTEDAKFAGDCFIQYYAYLISEADRHILSVLEALEESGQADNTIVVFCPDHGEYAGAHHSMTEKWHTGYEEILHVPMVVRFPKHFDVDSDKFGRKLRQIEQPTSHIDILPTILGLAGIDINDVMNKAYGDYHNLQAPVGIDLSDLIVKGCTKAIRDRDGVLFINYDTITEPLNLQRQMDKMGQGKIKPFEVYCEAVNKLKQNAEGIYPDEVSELSDGPVVQPGYVHCVVDKDNWKLVRYFDLNNSNVPSEYELYDLNSDINEQHNLVTFNRFPQVHNQSLHTDDRVAEIAAKAQQLSDLMSKLEQQLLEPVENLVKPLV